MPIVLIFILDPPRFSVRMVETTILARNEAVLESGAGSIPSLKIEPPIVQGSKDREVVNGRRAKARRGATLDGQASCGTGTEPAQRRDHGSRSGAEPRVESRRGRGLA